MKQDRFLTGILLFIGLLVVAGLVLFFVRRDSRTYGPENTPDGVVYNYVLAIQNRDFERAYAALAEGEHKPDYTYFLQNFQYAQMDAALEIASTRIEGNNAWVEVLLHYMGTGPFETGWSNPDTARLEKQAGAWKLTYMASPYWGYDWYQQSLTPTKP
jgi:hypothetical protein